jgi:prepilin-type N-terminal cleavage/methylation domain-containing protein
MKGIPFTRDGRGFTLVELLIVIAILGALAGIAVPLFLGQRTKAVITEAESNLQILRMLEEQYFAENGRYSPNLTTAYYNTTSTTIRNELPGFKPGEAASLKYDYSIKTCMNGTNWNFVAKANGRNNSAAKGTCFQIDHNNLYNSCNATVCP